MRIAIYIFLLSALLITTGCASVPMASLEQDEFAKKFTPEKGMSSLYIYRNEKIGAAVPLAVSVNGKTIGQTAAHTYFYLSLVPGKYKVESMTENVSYLELKTEANKSYFVWQEVKMGMWMARTHLQQMSPEKGRAGVLSSNLVATNISGNEIIPLDAQSDTESPSEKLRELHKLKDDGIITSEDYEQKKRQLLEKI